jgi:hypothetical protein
LSALVWIRRRVEPRDVLDCVKVVIECIQVAEPLGLHICDNAGIDEGEWFILAEQCFPRREGVGVE